MAIIGLEEFIKMSNLNKNVYNTIGFRSTVVDHMWLCSLG